MVNYNEIFNISSTALPLNRKEMDEVIDKRTMNGYIQCPYKKLIDTLKEISRAPEIPVSLNPVFLYNQANDPTNSCECIIQVEGLQTYQEFLNKIIQNEDTKEWSDFTTYSPLFKDEVKNLKLSAYKKYLWTYENFENWINDKNIGLISETKNELLSNFDVFKKKILESNDYKSFITSCNEEDIQNAINYMIKGSNEKLKKYSNELNYHIKNNNKRENQILLKNPLIVKIYLKNHYAMECKKDFPKIKFEILDKKNFDSISLWDV